MENSIDDVVAALKHAKKELGVGGVLLVGAGCSHRAGIPLASEFVEIIRNEYPVAYEAAQPTKSYADCMKALKPGVRQRLIKHFVDRARINWAHAGIATLLANGYIDRILTTNFDNLIIRACALMGQFPAVYDLAVAREFKPAVIPDRAVYYLHGQHTGFVMKNTAEEVREQAELLKPVFNDIGTKRPWIVVGYSGLNDPVFELLAEVPVFDFGLWWVGHRDREPDEHVRTRLLDGDHYASYVRGYDADSFFVTLAQRLSVFPPPVVDQPFSYVKGVLNTLTEWTSPGHGLRQDILRLALDSIESAIRQYESDGTMAARGGGGDPAFAGDGPVSGSQILALQVAGDHGAVLAAAARLDDAQRSSVSDAIAWAHNQLGDELSAKAAERPAHEGVALLQDAARAYEEALRLRPDLWVAVNNLGRALAEHATRVRHEPSMAMALLGRAIEQFEQATRNNPQDVHAFNSLGKVLVEKARLSDGESALPLLERASDLFQHALSLQPDTAYLLNNWGEALFERARRSPRETADRLLDRAADKHRQAAAARPNDEYAVTHWADCLLARARLHRGERAIAYLAQAAEKYRDADQMQPGSGYVLNNWGQALYEWGMLQGGGAIRLFMESAEKHRRAHEAWPTDAFALERLAESLLQAGWRSASGGERWFREAQNALEEALRLRPNVPQLLNNLGCALYELGRLSDGPEADALFIEAISRHQEAAQANPADVYALDNWGKVLLARARLNTGSRAESLLDEAIERHRGALELQPNNEYALCGWGDVLFEKARRSDSAGADALLHEAAERYRAALAVHPASERAKDSLTALEAWAVARTAPVEPG